MENVYVTHKWILQLKALTLDWFNFVIYLVTVYSNNNRKKAHVVPKVLCYWTHCWKLFPSFPRFHHCDIQQSFCLFCQNVSRSCYVFLNASHCFQNICWLFLLVIGVHFSTYFQDSSNTTKLKVSFEVYCKHLHEESFYGVCNKKSLKNEHLIFLKWNVHETLTRAN